jgi:long-chain acyl-CoA synthetase
MNINGITENEIRTHGEYVTAVYEGKEYTNVELDRTARKLGNALKKLGVKRGDRVIIQMPNYPEIGPSFGAIWKIGAVVVPMNHLIGEKETTYIYNDCGAETVITSSELIPKVEACRQEASAIKNVIFIDREVPKGYLSFSDLVSGSSDELQIVKTDDDELAALIYTSGTTGRPKGCMHSHFSLYSAARIIGESNNTPNDRVSVWVLPLCHIYGIACMLAGGIQGGWKSVVLRSFNVEKIFESIEKYKGTSFCGVPTMYVLMLLYPEPQKYDLSSMQMWTSGAAPLALETWKGFKEKYGFKILEGWGLTESGGSGCVSPRGEPIKVGSLGKPTKWTEVKIVDNNSKELSQGQEGELILRSPAVMKGYWNKPEETAEVLKDGWLYTGDIGYVDRDGYFFITDRKKDLIIKAGENISPREIEEVIFSHNKVAEAAVVGIKDTVYGEEIKAFVVLKPGEQANSEDILQHCSTRLNQFKVPKVIQFIDSLPKNLIGKVERKELRNMTGTMKSG